MITGIVIGVVIIILPILSFMAGYGMADMKHNQSEDTEE